MTMHIEAVRPGFLWWSVAECGGVWWSKGTEGALTNIHTVRVSEGEVINIHTMRWWSVVE
jgi:hypothetical protein